MESYLIGKDGDDDDDDEKGAMKKNNNNKIREKQKREKMKESWKSSAGLARMMPVRPPKRNVTRKPSDHSIGVSKDSFPPHIVPIQLKNFTPVGTAMSMVIRAKYGRFTAPVTNMWCAQTAIDRAAIAMVANTRPL